MFLQFYCDVFVVTGYIQIRGGFDGYSSATSIKSLTTCGHGCFLTASTCWMTYSLWSRFCLTVWCCAHSAQCRHLFLLASINGKKPPWLLLATCNPRRKQQPVPQHGGRSLTGLCCRSICKQSGPTALHTASRPGFSAAQKEARGL